MAAVVLNGCMRHAGRNVQQVMLIKAEKKDGGTHSRTIVFYRDGKAERNSFITDSSAAKPVSTEERGTFSTDSFERVAKTVEENNFFSKKEKKSDLDADGEFINLAVSSKDGSNEISNDIEVDPNDSQIQNIISAIEKEASQINWQPAK